MGHLIPIIPDLIKGIFDSAHPRRGGGTPETLILILIIAAAFGGSYLGIVSGGTLERVIDVLLGAFIGNSYQRKNGERKKPIRTRPPSVVGR